MPNVGRRRRWNSSATEPAEEKKELAEMNLTDHAGARLTHGKPTVNGVEIHYAIGGAGEPVFLLHGSKADRPWCWTRRPRRCRC